MVNELIELFKAECENHYSYVPHDDELPDGVKFVSEESSGSGRWHEYMMTIVEYKGQLYGVEWASGLTEYQENEFAPSVATVYPVKRVEKKVYTYIKV